MEELKTPSRAVPPVGLGDQPSSIPPSARTESIPTKDVRSPGHTEELSLLARGGLLSLVGAGISAVLGLLLVFVIGRGLHAQGTGLLLEAIALFSIFNNPVGADTGLVRMIALYRARHRTQDIRPVLAVGLWPTVAIGAAIGALVYAFAPQLVQVFFHGVDSHRGVVYIRVLAPFLPIALATTVALAGTRGLGTMLPYVSIQNLGVPLLRPVAIVAVIAAGLGSVAVALSWAAPLAIGFVATMVVLAYMVRRAETEDGPFLDPPRSHRRLAREFWAFSAPQSLASFFQVALLWLDVLLVGAYESTRAAGVYAVASRYAIVGGLALQAVSLALGPQVSRLLARHQKAEVESVFQAATWWLIAISWPIYMVLAVFSPFMMRIFGHDFTAGATSLTILSLGMLFFIGTGNNKTVLLMSGNTLGNLAITTIQLALNVGLNIVLIPRLGINGAAISWAVTIAVGNILITLVLWFQLRINPFGRGYPLVSLGSALAFGALGLVLRSVLGATGPALALCLVLGTGPYLALLWRRRRMLRLDAFRGMIRTRLAPGPVPAANTLG